MPRYEYNKLDETANEIRLVKLLPGVAKPDIAADLHTIRFQPGKPTQNFEALSYTWGSSEDATEIMIGHLVDCSLQVTRNLEITLRNLRYADRPRVMWIDAVCVNQQDLDERGEQVKRMADIYSRAKEVTVWIGPAWPQSTRL